MSRNNRAVLLLMFDLPVITKENRRYYRVFKKFLKQNGFSQFQESVYVKLLQNADSKWAELMKVSCFIPNEGNVSILTLPINQFKAIKVFGNSRLNMDLFADDFVII